MKLGVAALTVVSVALLSAQDATAGVKSGHKELTFNWIRASSDESRNRTVGTQLNRPKNVYVRSVLSGHPVLL